jgi:hypothetical protein
MFPQQHQQQQPLRWMQINKSKQMDNQFCLFVRVRMDQQKIKNFHQTSHNY